MYKKRIEGVQCTRCGADWHPFWAYKSWRDEKVVHTYICKACIQEDRRDYYHEYKLDPAFAQKHRESKERWRKKNLKRVAAYARAYRARKTAEKRGYPTETSSGVPIS